MNHKNCICKLKKDIDYSTKELYNLLVYTENPRYDKIQDIEASLNNMIYKIKNIKYTRNYVTL